MGNWGKHKLPFVFLHWICFLLHLSGVSFLLVAIYIMLLISIIILKKNYCIQEFIFHTCWTLGFVLLYLEITMMSVIFRMHCGNKDLFEKSQYSTISAMSHGTQVFFLAKWLIWYFYKQVDWSNIVMCVLCKE